MGRAILVFGILLTIAGAAGMGYGIFTMTGQLTSGIQAAVSPDAATLCRPDETLDEATGRSAYTPGIGYGREVSYYCVNSKGERREVTGQFVGGMLGQVFGSFGVFTLPMIGGSVMTVGIVLIVMGAIFSRRRGNAFASAGCTSSFPSTSAPLPNSINTDLSARLQQVEEARRAGLISYDEYKRLRQDILDARQ